MADNTVLNTGSGGDTIRDVAKTANSPAKTQVVILDVGGGADGSSEVALAVGQQTAANSIPVVHPSDHMSAKGSQPSGATYSAVQQPKDSGRTFVTITAGSGAPSVTNPGVTTAAATATLISFSQNVGGTQTNSLTSYTVPAGNTLRIQAINGVTRAATTTTTLSSVLSLVEAASAISTTSNVLLQTYLPIYEETSTGITAWELSIPDGLEIPAGTQIGFVLTNNLSTITTVVTLIGYIY